MDDKFERLDDEELVRQYVQTLVESYFAELLKRYQKTLTWHAKHYIGQGFKVPIEDLLQVGSIGLLGAAKNFNPELKIKFSSFATLCIKRKMLSLLSKETNVSSSVFLNYQPYDVVCEKVPYPSAEDRYMLIEQVETLKNLMEKSLTNHEQSVLNCASNGYTYQEIARMTNRKVTSISNTLFRSRKKLKKLLEELD
jgi:RNA polymerase sporulation-specific sigma factor